MSVHVTRHAIRRYAERVLGHVDIDELSDDAALQVLRDRGVDLVEITYRLRDTCTLAASLGAAGVRAFNARVILKGSVVVTVVPKDWCVSHYRRDARD